MAGVVRLQGLQGLKKTLTSVSRTRRSINTSSKKCEVKTPTECPPAPKEENWVSYGFDRNNKSIDRNATHATLFFSVSLCLVVGGFGLSYLPDPQLHDWAQREAYLVLRERERLGLPPIDRNLIDPAKIVLPSDEELGDTEIII